MASLDSKYRSVDAGRQPLVHRGCGYAAHRVIGCTNLRNRSRRDIHYFKPSVPRNVIKLRNLEASALCIKNTSITSSAAVDLQSEDEIAAHYAHLIDSSDSPLASALLWAHQNCDDANAISVIKGCAQWEDAIAHGIHLKQKSRRGLCKLGGIEIAHSKQMDSTDDKPLLLQMIRERLATRINSYCAPKKKEQKSLESWFQKRDPAQGLPEIEDRPVPQIATDASSTYERLRLKFSANQDDDDFVATTKTLSHLRGLVTWRSLRAAITDVKSKRKSLRREFNITWIAHGINEGKRER